MEKFYRIKVSFQEPARLSAGFKAQFKKELANNTLYLGIRFNPAAFERSAAINSLDLAYQCIEYFENTASDYGRVVCYVKEYPCYSDFMQTIIDADSRILLNYVENSSCNYKDTKTTIQNAS